MLFDWETWAPTLLLLIKGMLFDWETWAPTLLLLIKGMLFVWETLKLLFYLKVLFGGTLIL
jgi:hypothetical protein